MIALRDYGMFTDRGNAAIGDLVNFAKTAELTWPETYRVMALLSESNPDVYGEAMDTEVREIVYSRCGFKTAFYF
jgi:hypothetical protein